MLAIAPEPLDKPNLKPYWSFRRGDPITVSKSVSSRNNDTMVVNKGGYLRAAVWNESIIGSRTFEVDLLFDGRKVESWDMPALPGGYLVNPGSDTLITELDPRSGSHTFKLVIDPNNRVDETNEDDNVYELTVYWHQSEPEPDPPITFDDTDLAAAFAGIGTYLSEWQTVLGEERQSVAVRMADAGYYLITGKSIRDEPVVIEMHSESEYHDRVDELFGIQFATSPSRTYPDLLARRERFKTDVVGYTSDHEGKVLVVINAERPFADVLITLAHEFGHARQRIEAQNQNDVPRTDAMRGLFEAEAFVFSRVFLLTLEEHLGMSFSAYSDDQSNRAFIDALLRSFQFGTADDEHDLGALLLWGILFADGAVQHLEDSFTTNGALNASEALELYNHLITKDVNLFELYVDLRVQEFDDVVTAVRAAAFSRLQQGLPASQESAPGLFIDAVLRP